MPWRARCVETCTAGSDSGLGKRTDGNAGTAPPADSTNFAADAPGNGTQPRSVAYQRTKRIQQRDGETRSEAGICPRVKRSTELTPHNLLRSLARQEPARASQDTHRLV